MPNTEGNFDRRSFLKGSVAFATAAAHWRTWAAAEGLPAYYAEHLAAVESKVKARLGDCPSSFFFLTDPHVKWNRKMSGRIVAELIRRTGIRIVLCGGDLVEAFGADYPTDKGAIDYAISVYREHWVRPIRSAGGRLYTAKGNHDFTVRHAPGADAKSATGYTMDGLAARKFIRDEFTEGGIVSNADDPSACYYYFDDTAAKTRFIVADTTDSEAPGMTAWGVRSGMHDSQLRWLAERALGTTPAGYGIVAMHHIPCMGVVGKDEDAKRFTPWRTMLEAYQARKPWSSGGLAYDFSNAVGRIILDLTGHHHSERQTFSEGILHLTEPCDAAYDDYIYGSKPWCGDLPRKKKGTIYEQTLSVVQVDAVRRLVYVTRIGGGQDRVIHLDPVAVRVGATHRFAATRFVGSVSFACYDCDRAASKPIPGRPYDRLLEYRNDVASISPDGTLTAFRPGTSLVVARNAALEKEIFPVTVYDVKTKSGRA